MNNIDLNKAKIKNAASNCFENVERRIIESSAERFEKNNILLILLGVLKDLIIDDDPRIIQCLRQYEIDGNRKTLYKNCLNLAMRAKVE